MPLKAKFFYMLKVIQYFWEYLRDFRLTLGYSYHSPFEEENRRLYYRIIILAHAIEKGLSLKDPRDLFGIKKLRDMMGLLDRYDVGFSPFPVEMAKGAIESYVKLHRSKTPDAPFLEELEAYLANSETLSQCEGNGGARNIEPGHFPSEASRQVGQVFIQSRFSCRNYAPVKVSKETIRKVLEIAQSAPSQCNRQSVRVHCFQSPDQISSLLSLQGGTSGFTESIHNLFVVTSELTAWGGYGQRSQSYVDGGLFSQNLMLALHVHGLASCPLNLAITNAKEANIKRISGIHQRERLIMMIAFGEPGEENLLAARSARIPLESVLLFHP
ncbi:nitroreductase family protein [Cerasicoccus arenae]|uniref:Nitroreductase domain-containing protein n=2 Tax=Cerasicoccus arenae TaxID=424488 RepID=A0A8J3DCC3_9BACT|nr:nitroreductase family protein [Cerasicoccus arenae]MBK1858649.1 nitroreductase family protein [Cerasicoccus arenae]GHC04801.1 hypothetical protein GCM10007047_22050 [Cerasicoccus arenae]